MVLPPRNLDVFLGRLVPGVHSFISLPAGVRRMPLIPFLSLTLLGSLLWSGGLALAAAPSAPTSTRYDKYLGPASWLVVGGLLALHLTRVWKRQRH